MHALTTKTPPRLVIANAERALLVAVVALGAVLVVVAAMHFAPKWDGAEFMDLAKSLAHGEGWSTSSGEPDHHHAPAWPAFVALLGGNGAVAEIVSVALLWIVVY